MRFMKTNKTLVIVAVAMGLLISQPVALIGASTSAISDVSLWEGGVLRGQVVDVTGVAKANAAVAVYQNGQRMTMVTTDQTGEFQVKGLKGAVRGDHARGGHFLN